MKDKIFSEHLLGKLNNNFTILLLLEVFITLLVLMAECITIVYNLLLLRKYFN